MLSFELRSQCDKTITTRFETLSLSPLRLIKRRSRVKDLQSHVQAFYMLYSEWSTEQKRFKQEVERFKQILALPLSAISQKLIRELRVEDVPIETYLSIVELAQRDIATYKSHIVLWITVGASLLSAMLGALIGVFFAN